MRQQKGSEPTFAPLGQIASLLDGTAIIFRASAQNRKRRHALGDASPRFLASSGAQPKRKGWSMTILYFLSQS